MKTTLSPYLHFNGNCEEAINYYKNVFGGELSMMKFGDMPMAGEQHEPKQIMHAELKFDGMSLMASDGGKEEMNSKNFTLSLSGSNGETLKKYFDTLAKDGSVIMPVAKQPWGAEFGMCKDKYGVDWMVNIEAEKA